MLNFYQYKGILLAISVGAGQSQIMDKVLSPNEVTVARSYWPLKDKREPNKYQQQAIDLAWTQKFTMIQGPPGT